MSPFKVHRQTFTTAYIYLKFAVGSAHPGVLRVLDNGFCKVGNMHINIIAYEFAPFIEKSALAKDIVHLAQEATKADHTVSVFVPFELGIDLDTHAIARRLMPVKVPLPEGQMSCHRYDSRTADGVNVYLLDIDGASEKPDGAPQSTLFFAAVGAVMGTFTESPDGCIAVGTETAGFAAVLDENPSFRHLPVISVLSHLDEKTDPAVVDALTSADRIILNHGRLHLATLAERLHPLKEMLSQGHIQWMSTPALSPRGEFDKPSAKAAFQMASGLPVREDLPLVLFCGGTSTCVQGFLAKDVQAVIPTHLDPDGSLTSRYGDRLVIRDGRLPEDVLQAADGVVAGADLEILASSLTHKAIPIVTQEIAETAVDLEASLNSGSAIVVADLSTANLAVGLERLLSAFHQAGAFQNLLARLPGYASTWTKVTRQFEQLITEISTEKKQDGQTE